MIASSFLNTGFGSAPEAAVHGAPAKTRLPTHKDHRDLFMADTITFSPRHWTDAWAAGVFIFDVSGARPLAGRLWSGNKKSLPRCLRLPVHSTQVEIEDAALVFGTADLVFRNQQSIADDRGFADTAI